MSLRWALRRWTPKHIWYRLRLPLRRRRRRYETLRATASFGKGSAERLTNGPAIAFGEFSGLNGLGRAAAYDLELVRQRHSVVEVVDISLYLKSGRVRPLSLGAPVENAYFLCQPDRYELISRLVPPNYLAYAYRIGRWVWETPLFPEDWRFGEGLVHEIWAPSEFCAQTFRAALDVSVRVVPHAVAIPGDPKIDMRARLNIPQEAFLGLAVMDILSCPERKNPWDHVRAWKIAFGDDPSKILLMKLRVGKRTRMVVDELRDLIHMANNIYIITDDLSNDEIAALHRTADVYVSLHRSEGFGLNIYEALLIGTPTVAVDWSANAEYGPYFANYYPVTYELQPYKDWLGNYPDEDFLWAAPKLEDASRQLRQCASEWEAQRDNATAKPSSRSSKSVPASICSASGVRGPFRTPFIFSRTHDRLN